MEKSGANRINSIRTVSIESINTDRPGLRLEVCNDLKDSIKNIGLLNPLVVNCDYELIAGGRRYATVKSMGWDEVPVTLLDPDDDVCELIEELAHIDENISRKNLTEMEEEKALLRRKKIYEQLYPETRKGGDRKSDSFKTSKRGVDKKESFTANTSKRTGKSKASVERAIRRAEMSSDDLNQARSENIVNTSSADSLVRLSKNDQKKILPYLDRKNTSEVKYIVDLIIASSIDEVVRKLENGDYSIGIMQNVETLGVDLSFHLLKISEGEYGLSTEDLQKVNSVLGTLDDAIDEFHHYLFKWGEKNKGVSDDE